MLVLYRRTGPNETALGMGKQATNRRKGYVSMTATSRQKETEKADKGRERGNKGMGNLLENEKDRANEARDKQEEKRREAERRERREIESMGQRKGRKIEKERERDGREGEKKRGRTNSNNDVINVIANPLQCLVLSSRTGEASSAA